MSPVARCAAHPSRPAVDDCPDCGRPRCDADRAAGDGCAVCRGRTTQSTPVLPDPERLVRAALAAYAAAIAGGYVTAEYVGADLFKYLSPAFLGVICGFAATAAARNPGPGALSTRIRWLTVVFGVLGTAWGFVLEGTYGALSTSLDVLVPYLLAGAAGWLWTAPPRKPKKA